MRTGVLGVWLAVGLSAPATGQEQVIDVRGARPPAPASFEAHWRAYQEADAAGDEQAAVEAFGRLRMLRIERNIERLDSVARPLVARGLARLRAGERELAQRDFEAAQSLDPKLPEAYFALAVAQTQGSVLGAVPALRTRLAGLWAYAQTHRGRASLLALASTLCLVVILALATVLTVGLLVRYGPCFVHDIEERVGAGKGWLAVSLCSLLLLVPLLALQGYGWWPLWALALSYTYMTTGERSVTLAVVVATMALGPLLAVTTENSLRGRHPSLRVALAVLERGPDRQAAFELEQALAGQPGDRDLNWLLGIVYRKDGRYEDAAAVYRRLLEEAPQDGVALNNLANIEFAQRDFPAAIARYRQAAASASSSEVEATLQYNLSLAYLQKFERQAANAARSEADRLAGELVRGYDRRWKYDNGEYGVVDLTPSPEQLSAKFVGSDMAGFGGPVLAGLSGRFTAAGALFALVAGLVAFLRGKKTFTLTCVKCGAAFCRRCHLGPVVGGLCTQCQHLFVVRDGVSGPARTQKMVEVQAEEIRRDRIFRVLSLISPGAGHIYARRPLLGAVLTTLWYGLLSLMLLPGRVIVVTDAPVALTGFGHVVAGALMLAVIYVVANRMAPAFVASLPPPRRSRMGREVRHGA